jgi:putative membrane protein
VTSENRDQHGGLKGVADRIGDAVGGAVGMASAATAGGRSSTMFLKNAAIGNAYEIEAARIALDRSRSEEVKGFARQMIDDHTTAANQLRSALATSEAKDVGDIPDQLDNRRRGLIEHLRDAPESDFDKRYVDQQVTSHQETATLLENYAENGDNSQLRSWANSVLPVVRRHLEQAKRLRGH